MNHPSLDLVRASVRTLVDRSGAILITPDGDETLGIVGRLAVAAATPLTLEQVDERLSFYIPEVGAELLRLVSPQVREELGDRRSAVVFGRAAWDNGRVLGGVGPHEVGHRWQDVRAGRNSGVFGSLAHSTLYALHGLACANAEGVCYTMDLGAWVIFDGGDPEEFIALLKPALAETYRLHETRVEHVVRTLRQAAASYAEFQLHGTGTPFHELLSLLVEGGWDPGPWRPAIVGGA